MWRSLWLAETSFNKCGAGRTVAVGGAWENAAGGVMSTAGEEGVAVGGLVGGGAVERGLPVAPTRECWSSGGRNSTRRVRFARLASPRIACEAPHRRTVAIPHGGDLTYRQLLALRGPSVVVAQRRCSGFSFRIAVHCG